jgi:hypothetical protein
MRTTVDLPEDLLRELRERAAREGRTLSDLVTDAAKAFTLRQQAAPYHAGHTSVPLSKYAGGGLLPGIDLANNAELLDVMEADLPLHKRR